jgi:polyferredoxin
MFERIKRPRVLIYGAVLVLISVAFLASLSWRQPLKVDVVRDRASLARVVDEGRIENVYRVQLMNATEREQRYRIGVQGLPGIELPAAGTIDLPPAQARWVTLAARVPPDAARNAGPGAHAIQFQIDSLDQPGVTVSEKSTFIVPR